MTKFQKGQTVKVKEGFWRILPTMAWSEMDTVLVEEMRRMAGQTAIVTHIDAAAEHYRLDDEWHFNVNWLEPAVMFSAGEMVRITIDQEKLSFKSGIPVETLLAVRGRVFKVDSLYGYDGGMPFYAVKGLRDKFPEIYLEPADEFGISEAWPFTQPKYQWGDWVVIGNCLKQDDNVSGNLEMAQYNGQTACISSVTPLFNGRNWRYELEGNGWFWAEKWLEPATKYQMGQAVRITSDPRALGLRHGISSGYLEECENISLHVTGVAVPPPGNGGGSQCYLLNDRESLLWPEFLLIASESNAVACDATQDQSVRIEPIAAAPESLIRTHPSLLADDCEAAHVALAILSELRQNLAAGRSVVFDPAKIRLPPERLSAGVEVGDIFDLSQLQHVGSSAETLRLFGATMYHLFSGQSEWNRASYLLDGYRRPLDSIHWPLISNLLAGTLQDLESLERIIKRTQSEVLSFQDTSVPASEEGNVENDQSEGSEDGSIIFRGVVTVPGLNKNFIAGRNTFAFNLRINGEVQISGVNQFFHENFIGKIEPPSEKAELLSYEIYGSVRVDSFHAFVGDRALIATLLAQMYDMMNRGYPSCYGNLSNDGRENVFFVHDCNKILRIVKVSWRNSGWLIEACPFDADVSHLSNCLFIIPSPIPEEPEETNFDDDIPF